MNIRLLSGSFEGEDKAISDSELEKEALLVYEGKFNSMDGEVEITGDHLTKMVESQKTLAAKLSAMTGGKLLSKFCPPIQLDHSTSAKDTVGRLMPDLRMGEYQREDGEKVKALYGKLKILGRDNVEKVKDGRWTHLSIGADLETGKISELTITPFPAAPEASLLSAAKLARNTDELLKIANQMEAAGLGSFQRAGKDMIISVRDAVYKSKVENMFKQSLTFDSISGCWVLKVKDAYDTKLSSENSEEGESMDIKKMKEEVEKYEKCKKHLMETTQCSEEDAEKKLSEMKDDEKTSMAAEADAKMSKLAEEEAAKKLEEDKKKEEDEKKLKEESEKKTTEMKRLMADIKTSQSAIQLAAKKQKVLSRLSAFKAEGKITPAEIKALELDKTLKEKSDAEVTAMMDGFEKREPVIHMGMFGSVQSTNLAELVKSDKEAALMREMVEDMPSIQRMMKDEKAKTDSAKRLAEGEGPEKVEVHVDATPHTDIEELCKMMDEGKLEEVKEKLRKMGKKLSQVDSMSSDEDVKALEEQVSMMQSKMTELAKLANIEAN